MQPVGLADILSPYEGTRILVSGGSGYLAANLVQALLPVRCQLIRLSRNHGKLPPLSGVAQVEDFGGDIRQLATWKQAVAGVQFIFHFAAQTSVPIAAADPEADLGANVLPMLQLLEACRQFGTCPVVLFAGTATQAGLTPQLPVDETHLDSPLTVYDLHKLAAENYLKHYVSQGFVRGASLRLANVYGPGPRSSSSDRGILNTMIRRALAGESLTLYGLGQFVRDYVFVADVIRAFLTAGTHPDALAGRHFVIGSGTGHTLAAAFNLVAQRVAHKTGQQVAVQHVPQTSPLSPIEERNFVANTKAFRRATDWLPLYDLATGIDTTIEALA